MKVQLSEGTKSRRYNFLEPFTFGPVFIYYTFWKYLYYHQKIDLLSKILFFLGGQPIQSEQYAKANEHRISSRTWFNVTPTCRTDPAWVTPTRNDARYATPHARPPRPIYPTHRSSGQRNATPDANARTKTT